jgi:hypothetical protein
LVGESLLSEASHELAADRGGGEGFAPAELQHSFSLLTPPSAHPTDVRRKVPREGTLLGRKPNGVVLQP